MLTIYSSTCYGDTLSKAPLHFDLEDYTDHVNTLTIHPLELAKKNYIQWPEDEIIEEYSDFANELKNISSNNTGLLSGRNWILHNIEILQKAIKIYKEERIGIFVKIYFPETFLDKQWINILWNFYCNISKKTDVKILVYTHMDYDFIKKLSKNSVVKLGNKYYVECVYPVSTWDKIKYFFSKIKNIFKTNR
jgi:hypothetical protein